MDVRVQGAGRGDECSVILESNQLPIFSISFTVQKIGRFSAVCRAGQVQISVSNTNVDISASNEGYPKVRNHGEGPYQGLLLVERGYYLFHI